MRKGRIWLMAAAAAVALAGICILSPQDARTHARAGSSSASLGLMLLDGENCVQVLAVTDQSPADYAGFQPGDRILRTGTAPVNSTEDFEQLVNRGKTLECLVRRDGREMKLRIPFR